MESGAYERGVFGDLMLLAIACGTKKFILIFNTHLDSPHDPIYVCDPRKFGVEPDSDIPIVLAYDLSHYESLHTVNNEDTLETISPVHKVGHGKTNPRECKDTGGEGETHNNEQQSRIQ